MVTVPVSISIVSFPDIKHYKLDLSITDHFLGELQYSSIFGRYISAFYVNGYLCIFIHRSSFFTERPLRYLIKTDLDSNLTLSFKRKDDTLNSVHTFIESLGLTRFRKQFYPLRLLYPILSNNPFGLIFKNDLDDSVFMGSLLYVDSCYYCCKPILSYSVTNSSQLRPYFDYPPRFYLLKGEKFKDNALVLIDHIDEKYQSGFRFYGNLSSKHLSLNIKDYHFISEKLHKYDDVYFSYTYPGVFSLQKDNSRFYIVSEIDAAGSVSFSYFVSEMLVDIVIMILARLNKAEDFQELFKTFIGAVCETLDIDYSWSSIISRVLLYTTAFALSRQCPTIGNIQMHVLDDYYIIHRPYYPNHGRGLLELNAVLDRDLNILPTSSLFFRQYAALFQGKTINSTSGNNVAIVVASRDTPL